MFQRLFITLTLVLFAGGIDRSHAEEVDGVANYAYSVFAGTGQYQVDDRTIYVFRAPLEWDIREVDYENGETVGLRFMLPLAVGITDFDTLDELPELTVDDLQTLSVVPGIEIPVAINADWEIKPFAQAGFGFDAKSDSDSFIWGAGVRVASTLGADSNWLVGGEFLWAGNNPGADGPKTSFTRWGVGAEYKIPTRMKLFDRYLSWHLRAIQWRFSEAVVFEEPLIASKLNNSTEVGVSIGFSRSFKFLGYHMTQLGAGYEKADDYEAIKLFTTFPF